MNRSTYHDFERLRTELSEQQNRIVTKVDMLDLLIASAKTKGMGI
ncbi:hypothetical protein [Rufibacter sp. XAAS-G3-1]|nr:hypothetical protein [Rufibacter sp. XAAS-G3-1]